MDIWYIKNLLHSLLNKRAISGEEFDILNDFTSEQNNKIESLQQEGLKKDRQIISLKG